jgi:hypothetical protein
VKSENKNNWVRKVKQKQMSRSFFYILVVLLSFFLCACSIRGLVVDEVARTAGDGIAAFEQEEDLVLMEKAFPANIKLLELFLESRPDNRKMLTLLAQLYGSYGSIFFETRLEALRLGASGPIKGADPCCEPSDLEGIMAAQDRCFLRGQDYALRALTVRHKSCRQMIENLGAVDVFFASLKKEDVPALFWYGFNLAGHVNLHRDSIKTVSRAFFAQKAMLRVIELDPGYFHGTAHLVLLTYYGSRSKMTGGNPEAAQKHYEALKKIAGKDFLLADVFYARYLLVQQQEKEKFTTLLNRVIARESSGGRYGLLNRTAVCRAGLYLGAVDYFFID